MHSSIKDIYEYYKCITYLESGPLPATLFHVCFVPFVYHALNFTAALL